MTRRRTLRLLTSLALVLASGQALAQAGMSAEPLEPGWAEIREIMVNEIAAFKIDPVGCQSVHLSTADEMVATLEAASAKEGNALEMNLQNGLFTLDVADAARNRGCRAKAEKLYAQVVAVYTGSSYTGLRERAELGIRQL